AMTVTKADIINQLSEATGLTKKEVEVILDGVLFTIIDSVRQGNRIEVRGFGSFSSKERYPRKVKNPKTNQIIDVAHRFVPVFKPAKDFRESVNQSLLEKKRKAEVNE
ncbi:MAG: integration host factor subunit beta, partial [Calditrichia bacterium]|nr:integration host factor subunit beta [Calditrichia bacterium]